MVTSDARQRLGLKRAEIAAAMGVSVRTVDGWRDNGCPRLADGSWNADQVREWVGQHRAQTRKNRGAAPAPEGSIAAQIEQEELLIKRAKRVQEEIAAKLAEGTAIDMVDVERERVARVLEVRQGLEAMGSRIVPQLKGLSTEEQIDVIDEYVRNVLDRFARGGAIRKRIKRGPGRPSKNG